MLRKDITYEDFNGDTVTETFYFHISKPELVELEVDYEDGLVVALNRLLKSKNNKEILAQFKKIIMLSYGIKSDDGKRFIKNEKLREDFSQTAAYQTLFMELALDEEQAAEFIKGVLPKDFSGGDQDKPVEPPSIPPVTTT